MNSKHIYYSILTALIIVGLYHLFEVGRYSFPEYKLKAGQVSDIDVIAPFSFPILKSGVVIEQEKQQAVSQLQKPYRISDDVLFNAKTQLDDIFQVILSGNKLNQSPATIQALKNKGVELTAEAIMQMGTISQAENIYSRLAEMLDELYSKGIYSGISVDSILVSNGDELRKRSIRVFTSLEEARQRFMEFGKSLGVPLLCAGIAPALVKANLIVDDNMLDDMAEQVTQDITGSKGIIQKNEIIVRKNVRVSDEDIDKLNSLQAAFQSRQVRKSPLQRLLLSLGLALYMLIILLLTNKYYIQTSQKGLGKIPDILPMNLGFVLLVLLACINNYILGFSNILIPFAMFGLAAIILVSVNFGVFYSIACLLVLSPFINWETYTPTLLILSTLITVILTLRYNSQHEFVNIWLYMLAAGIAVNFSVGIYKSDPLITILSNFGYSMISATISIIGLAWLITHYEKKWHFATKQTLLELLDFEHPLLKRLATDAVGTYHHSLIVGNLSERAAVAIGANPLLARVGSYYHDIGKVINTEVFTENNEDSSDIHDRIKPEDSARLIKGHVLEGVRLAEDHHIPHPVIDIIMQHHGTSYIRYFLEQAKKADIEIDPELYSYPGPKPTSKEAALVMIADIVESTTKAKNITKEEDISNIIDQTILRLVREHQLDDSPITMKDLQIAKQTMIPVLESIYRKRLDYPEEKHSESPDN